MPKIGERISLDEFLKLPLIIGCEEYAMIYGCNFRYALNHAEELGAKKTAGRWCWSKVKIAEDLGIEL